MSTSRVFSRTPPPELLMASVETSMPSTRTATFCRPRVGDRPRIVMRVSLFAAPSSNSTDDRPLVMSAMLFRPFRSSSSAVIALMAIGTSCRLSSRLRALTMISSTWAQPVAGARSGRGLHASVRAAASERPLRDCAMLYSLSTRSGIGQQCVTGKIAGWCEPTQSGARRVTGRRRVRGRPGTCWNVDPPVMPASAPPIASSCLADSAPAAKVIQV